jgi:hypothetical protein
MWAWLFGFDEQAAPDPLFFQAAKSALFSALKIGLFSKICG